MKQAYRQERRFRPETRALLDKIISVVEDYGSQGYRLTLRQLYYQLVAAAIIANVQKNYAKLSDLLGEARMCGLVDWEIIEDRIRVPKFPNEFSDIADGIGTLLEAYRLNRWQGQEKYVEVWVEKDALSGVLNPITQRYHVRLLVNRGYSSISAMHDAALRFMQTRDKGKDCFVLYFGDHDPRGEDMVRDIDSRLTEFGCQVEVKKIALTMEQVRQYNPPPNPAKMSDPRSSEYVAKHGEESWELDALPPRVLNQLLVESIEDLLDKDLFDQLVERESLDKKKLKGLGDRSFEEAR